MHEEDVFLPQEFVRRKRDGEPLQPAEIERFVRGLTDGSVTDGQIAACAMAVHFRGMTHAECVALTQAMTRSGERLTWDDADLDGPVQSVDGRALGMRLVELGAGRRRPADVIDPTIGLTAAAGPGDPVHASTPLCRVHLRDAAQARRAVAALRACFGVGSEKTTPGPVVLERIGADA